MFRKLEEKSLEPFLSLNVVVVKGKYVFVILFKLVNFESNHL